MFVAVGDAANVLQFRVYLTESCGVNYGDVLVCTIKVATLNLWLAVAVCHTFLATWSRCHRLFFLWPNLATLMVTILFTTLFCGSTVCLMLAVAIFPSFVTNLLDTWIFSSVSIAMKLCSI